MPTMTPFDLALLFNGRCKPYLEVAEPFGKQVTIDFQFPPLVKSDSKGGNWQEYDLRQAEPLPIYKGGSPRLIDLRWSYIVTDSQSGGNKWDIDRIERNVKQCRAYFYNHMGSEMLIRFRAYDQVGGYTAPDWDWTFRADSVDISYSDTIIMVSDRAFPLRTDLSMKLKLYTNIAKATAQSTGGGVPDDGGGFKVKADGLDGQKKILLENIKGLPTHLSWF